jgi:hypothetical protein
MFNRKQSQVSIFNVAVGSGLLVSVAFVAAILAEAVSSMQVFA